MRSLLRTVALLVAVSAGAVAARRLLAMSNTQVHRINQDKPFVTEKEIRS
jgi:hypothetical protein